MKHVIKKQAIMKFMKFKKRDFHFCFMNFSLKRE